MSISAGGKGDKRRPLQVDREHLDSEYERLFGNKVQPGKYKADPHTGKMIPIDEWYAKYYEEKPKTHFIIGDIEPYQSPIDDRIIHSRKDHRDDLARHGCRVYEGREQETREAQRYTAEQDAKFQETVSESVEKTFHDIKENNIEVDRSGKIPFTFGL